MNDQRIFTTADDQRLSHMIHAARHRLVVVAPGLSEAVGTALAKRIRSADAPSSIAVTLDVDPEVCRLGYGTLAALEEVKAALASTGQRLGTTDGLRIGLVISDGQTLVYGPTPLLIEAGATAPTKPNAILLRDAPSDALAAACGLGQGLEAHLFQEVGSDYVNTATVEAARRDLEEKPPKRFDLARVERVFNYELQFVEFKVEDFSLDRRSISLDPGWLGLSDLELKNRFRNSFKLFEKGEGMEVEINIPQNIGYLGDPGPQKVSEATIHDLTRELRKDFLIPLGHYGSVIRKRDLDLFQSCIDELKAFLGLYSQAVSKRLDAELGETQRRLLENLVPDLVRNPPKDWSLRAFNGKPDEARIRELLAEGLQAAFGKVRKDFVPKVTVVFKDVTYTTIVEDPKFRMALESQFGAQDVAKLLDEHDAAPAVGGFGHES